MKKILLSLGMVMSIFLLTACGGLDAFELLELSYDAESDSDSFVMEMTADISTTIEGMSVDVLMTMSVEAESEDRSRTDTSTSFLGQSEETTIFVRDGNEYTERIEGDVVERSRSESNGDDLSDIEGADLTGFLSEDTVYESSATSIDDGYRLEFVLNMDGVSSLLEELDLGDVVNDQSDESEDDEEVENTMVMYLDEDHVGIALEISLVEIDIIIENDEATITLDVELTTDQDVTIDFPDWLDVDPVSEAELVGVWSWEGAGLGSEHMILFDSDGTGFFIDNTLGDMLIEEFTWEILNDNHLYTYFEANIIAGYGAGRHEIIDIDRNSLTQVDLDDGIEATLDFIMTVDEFLDLLEELMSESESGSVSEFDLIGAWEQVGGEDEHIIFFDIHGAGATLTDPSGNLHVGIFTWDIISDTLYLNFEGTPGEESYTVTLEDDTLIMVNLDSGDEYVFQFSMNLVEFTDFLESLVDEFQ